MASKRKLLPGYKYLGGSSRRYKTPSGKTISRRQYENLRYKKAGYSSWSQFQRIKRKDPKAFRRWVNRGAEINDLGISDITAPESEFNRLLAKAANDDFSHAARGSFHDFLTYIGYRTPEGEFDYDIGDTP